MRPSTCLVRRLSVRLGQRPPVCWLRSRGDQASSTILGVNQPEMDRRPQGLVCSAPLHECRTTVGAFGLDD
jgi:hypothetical protein